MDIAEIKKRMTEIGITREQLGEQLGVKKRTVDAWLSCGVNIPLAKMTLIEQILSAAPPLSANAMAQSVEAVETARAARDAGLIRAVSITFVADEFELVLEAARDSGKTVEEYILESALKECGNPAGVRATEQNAAG